MPFALSRRSRRPFALALCACLLAPACEGRRAAAAKVARGDQLLAQGKAVEALAEYEQALAAGDSERAARGMGLSLALLRRWTDARARLLPYAKEQPEDFQARVALVSAHLGSGDEAAARVEAKALAHEAPAVLLPQLIQGVFAQNDAQRRAALEGIAAWERQSGRGLGRASPSPAEATLLRASLHSALGEAQDAKRAAQAAEASAVGDLTEATWLADLADRAGQPRLAEGLLLLVTKAAPNAHAAQRALAEVALELGHDQRALAALDQLGVLANGPLESVLRARAEIGLGRADQAEKRLRAVLHGLGDQQPTFAAHAELWLARALVDRGELEGARAALGAAVAAKLPDAALVLAQVELAAGKAEAALGALDALPPRLRAAPEAQRLAARAHVAKGEHAQAERMLAADVAAHPDDAIAHYEHARVLEAQGKADVARVAFARALELSPGHLPSVARLLALSDAASDAAAGDRLLRAQVALSPGTAALHVLLGQRLERAGLLAAAEAAYKSGLDAAGGTGEAALRLCDLYAGSGRRDEAERIAAAALRADPNHLGALLRSARLASQRGDADAAIAQYRRALTLRANDVGALNNLAMLLAERPGELDEALRLAQAAHAAAPVPEVADTLGLVRLKRGETEEALALIEPAAAKLPDNPQVQLHLGLALLASGKRAPAKAALARAIALDPKLVVPDEARALVTP